MGLALSIADQKSNLTNTMDNFLAARSQMALSLGFHIIFASIGIAMPFLMALSYALFFKTGDPTYKTLTKAWSKGVAIFFAVGAVSGTALSFELGLLWPKFMEYAGPIIGMPFSWEGTAFFLEAIALGIFLYGWDKVPPKWHWVSALVVGLSGVASGFFVICANAWMNSPAGFDWNNGNPVNIDPWAAMFNSASGIQGVHMIVGAFEAVGFAVAGVHAYLWLKTRYRIHRLAVQIAFTVAAIFALVQPLIGDFSAKSVAVRQPLKLAAMESLFETKKGAPLLIGGLPDPNKQKISLGIELPKLLSFLAYGDFNAEVKGLNEFPKADWPPVVVTHLAFQLMVAIGTFLALLGVVGFYLLWKRRQYFFSPLFQNLLVASAGLGFLAIEAGWVVTETGRQPWIIYGLLKTKEALTPRPDVIYTFYLYVAIYGLLSVLCAVLLFRQIRKLHQGLSETGEQV